MLGSIALMLMEKLSVLAATHIFIVFICLTTSLHATIISYYQLIFIIQLLTSIDLHQLRTNVQWKNMSVHIDRFWDNALHLIPVLFQENYIKKYKTQNLKRSVIF